MIITLIVIVILEVIDEPSEIGAGEKKQKIWKMNKFQLAGKRFVEWFRRGQTFKAFSQYQLSFIQSEIRYKYWSRCFTNF